jgi:ABC-type multidrug transport system fused ATPase/permease subunit
MKDNPSVAHSAWLLYRQEIGKIWPTALNVFWVTLGVLAVAYFWPSMLVFTIPLVLFSFFFAYQLSVSYLRKGNALTNKQFFSFFGAYFRMPFYGSYRIFRNALFAILYAIVGGILTGFVYYGIASAVSSAFQSDWASLISYAMNNQVDETNSLLQNSAALLLFENTVAFAEATILFFAFFLEVGFYGLSPYLRSVILGASPRVSNAIFVGGIREAKGFWGDYFKTMWPLGLALLLGYGGGSGITLLYSHDPYYLAYGGVSGALILLSPLLPYYFEAAGLLMEKYRKAFSDYSISLAQRTLKQLEDAKQMSEEEAQAIKKSIDDAKKLEEENPPLPPLDDGATPPDDDGDDHGDDGQ